MTTRRIWIAVLALTAIGAAGTALQIQDDPTTKTLMKAKTGYAHRLLDAVVQEDFDVIREQAFRLRAVAETADWKASQNPAFVREGEAFIQASDRLLQAARDENGDAAALAFVDVTLRCVHCHRQLKQTP